MGMGYYNFQLKGGNILRGVAGVSRGPIPEGRPDGNDSHSLGARKSLIVGADLTTLSVPLRQLYFIQ